MRKFKHRKTGEIATYRDGVLKSSGFCVEIGVEPSSEFWEEIKEELPIGTKVKDSTTGFVYRKISGSDWDIDNSIYKFAVNESDIGEGKRFQIVKEEVKKDFEILKFIKGNNTYNVLEDGNLLHDIPEYKNIKTNPSATHWTRAIERGYNTHSVKRLSDGEVFQLGDSISHIINDKISKITKINLIRDKIYFSTGIWESETGVILNNAVKAKPVLFVTEDGKEIREGDEYYYVLEPINNYIMGKNNCTKFGISLDRKGIKYFSVKEAAENYIILSKPCLSINDLKNTFPHLNKIGEDIIKLKQLVKNKL